ncbi:C3 and PZP-like alpha-2-macroglobulin domain-containing protein 8 [Exaiptasia diaphana]|nr:C3 and PZP-like alpha-2-macroglobulin domain-containing protein 8 [Exaiptasia diaphana]
MNATSQGKMTCSCIYFLSLNVEYLLAASSFKKTLELALPKSYVQGSARAKVTVIGDILGSSFSNLDNLLRMPYGCGEQNMVNFAPNIFVLKYLTTVNKVTEVIKSKAENYMVKGYQREQTFRHKDGSYSAFGERDKEGSMWLTAFVVKSYAQARKYIYIDPDSLKLSLNFMRKKQNQDGSFPTLGKVHGSYLKDIMLAKQEGVGYLEKNLDAIISKKDVYALSLTTYALKLVNSADSEKAKRALFDMAIKKG